MCPVSDANIGFNNAPPVENQGVGDDQIDGTISIGDGGLTHTISDDLATAEFHFIAVVGATVAS
jgi:hypothetical protein